METSKGVSEAELVAAVSLADPGKKRSKKAVKKVSIIQHVAPAFSDDEAEDEPRRSGYFTFVLHVEVGAPFCLHTWLGK
jgi:hypothetical protein